MVELSRVVLSPSEVVVPKDSSVTLTLTVYFDDVVMTSDVGSILRVVVYVDDKPVDTKYFAIGPSDVGKNYARFFVDIGRLSVGTHKVYVDVTLSSHISAYPLG